MSRFRITLAQLMALVLFFGFGFTALRNADTFWASATYTLAITLIAASLVGAIVRIGEARSAWIGFAAFGSTYLLVARLPDQHSPIAGRIGGPYLLIELGLARLASSIYPPGAVANWAEYAQTCNFLGIILFGLIGGGVC